MVADVKCLESSLVAPTKPSLSPLKWTLSYCLCSCHFLQVEPDLLWVPDRLQLVQHYAERTSERNP
jgi:hypothetical protein